MRSAAVLLAALLLVGCDSGSDVDAAAGRDAGDRDGGTLDAGATDGGEDDDAGALISDAGAPLRDDAEDAWRWDEQAQRLMDGASLADAFSAEGYSLPSGASVYALRVVPGVDQPAFELFEAGGGAFGVDFWPASTIKLLSSVAALEFVGARRFSGAARMTWDSGYNDVLRAIIDRAIRVSSNPDYDRTLRVAGLDWINSNFLTAERGFGATVLTSSYGGLPVRDVSGLTMTEGAFSDYVPARTTTGSYGRNDTSLFELIEGLRRVMLHDELAPAHRFMLGGEDVTALRDALCGSTVKYFRTGARAALGDGVRVCNKYGFVPSADCLDHALVEIGAERYLLAAVVPAGRCDAELSEIAEHTLRAIRGAPAATPLQLDAGVVIVVQRDDLGSDGSTRTARLTVDAPGATDVDVSVGRAAPIAASGPGRFVVELGLRRGGDRLVIVRAYTAGSQVGYRALRLRFDAP